jgi:phosphonoacetaldehyde hydrolase
MPANAKIKLVVFDLGGTVVDFGCQAPTAAFLETFAKHRVMLTVAQVRGPMGLAKYDHVRTLLEMPAVGEQFQIVHGRRWTEADALEIYHDLGPIQADLCRRHSDLTPHVLECAAELRRREIRLGTTTGYPREIAELVWEAAESQGFAADANVAADDTSSARPAPWMVLRVMQELEVFPPSCVVKIGDTVPDIEEGLNAGCWSLGVTNSGSEIGLSSEQWSALDESTQRSRQAAASRKLTAAGAHYVVPTLADLPGIIDRIETRLESGERP